jgi:hypothetical protein
MFRIIRKIRYSDKEIGFIKSHFSNKRNYISTEDAICDTLVKQTNELKDIRIKMDYIVYNMHKMDRRLINNEYTSKELLTTNLQIVSRLDIHKHAIQKMVDGKNPIVYDKP